MPVAKRHQQILFGLFTVFLLSLVVNWRAIESISLAASILYALVFCRDAYLIFMIRLVRTYPWIPAFILPVSLAWILIPATLDQANGLRIAFLRSGLLLVPAGFAVTGLMSIEKNLLLKKILVITQVAAILLLVIIACNNYMHDRQTNHFFYHRFVSSFREHAVHVSIMVFACLLILLESGRMGLKLFRQRVHVLLISILVTGIILLSSKLVIVFSFFTIIYYLGHIKWAFIVSVIFIALLIFISPVRARFSDFIPTDAHLLHQTSFSSATYLNGFEFRFLQWSWIPQIIRTDHTWVLGEHPGDAQGTLDEHYRKLGLYQGDGSSDKGFIGYNTHNTYLEALLQTGIIGLLATLVVIYLLIVSAIRIRSAAYRIMVMLIFCYSLAESLWETQSGITLFCLLPLLLGSLINHGNQKLTAHSQL